MAEEKSQKTEPATPRRREEARRKGQVAQSRELQTVVLLVVAVVLLGSGLAVHLAREIVFVAGEAWASPPPQSLADYHGRLLQVGSHIGVPLVAILALLALAGSLAAFAQIGPAFSFEALAPRADRLSLLQGMKRMVDLDRAFDLLKSLFKVAVVAVIIWTVLARSMERVIGLSGVSLEEGLVEAVQLGRDAAIGILVFLGAMALIDAVYQRWRLESRLRMSKKEVRDEMKDREGDPLLRSRARSLQRELTRSRMISAVADADVVITNPTHYAVALQYQRGLAAPRVLAKGRNHVAARIREVARENGVPVVENKPLARLLHRTAVVGREIPETLFQAVAEVLAYVYRLDPVRAQAWRAAP